MIWILLDASQGQYHPLRPVTALWLIAIPLMDMVAIMYRRLRKGQTPFYRRPSTYFIIWSCALASLPVKLFVLITSAAALLAGIGVMGEFLDFIPEWFMMLLFLMAFFVYGYCLKHAWRVARRIRRNKRAWQLRRKTADVKQKD